MTLAFVVAGARPNLMKVKPVIDALEDRSVDTVLVHTGQHADPSMSDLISGDLGLRVPDVHLGVRPGTHAEVTAQVMVALEPLVADRRPDELIVVGDVTSTLAAALVGAKADVRLSHVEAGLRSGDWTMPEEVNRVVVDRISDLLFAPSADAVENLRGEGTDPVRIHLVGNVMVDTLLAQLDRARARAVPATLGLSVKGYGMLTLHRPSNVDQPQRLSALLAAVAPVSARVPLLFPVHPRTRTSLDQVGLPAGITAMDPLGYLDFLALQADAAIVLTDSGGVQEETTVLGVPCLTLRPNTERPITVSEGTNTVVGDDPARIAAAADRALSGLVPVRRPKLWDGAAAARIAAAIIG